MRLFDCKCETLVKCWEAAGEIERVLWNHFDSNYLIVSTANGYIHYIDIREDKPIWSIEAHTKEVTGLSLSSSCYGLLVTSANDGVIKIWDIINNTEPQLIFEKRSNLGALLCLTPNPDNPFVFAAGGDKKSCNFKVFNFLDISEVRERFQTRINVQNGNNSTAINQQNDTEEMVDVTEHMDSMILNAHGSRALPKHKKYNK